MSALHVYLGDRRAGELSADEQGRLTFVYADPQSPALSLSLPARQAAYTDAECRPFFAGLLPEGSALQMAAASRRLQIYETFKLLEAFGGECAGAVRLLPSGSTPEIKADYERLDDHALAREIAKLTSSPNFADDRRVRLSVAGVQAKAAVRVTETGIFKPLYGSPSTHILKVGNPEYPDLAQNEAFCLRLADRLGIRSAQCELRRAGTRPYLLVQRYDRTAADGAIAELHQEDFCQALRYPPERKYELDDESGEKIGPGFAECFALLDNVREPAVDIERLLRLVVFNFLIGNADAHAKNLSLLYDRPGAAPVLAPAYDLVSTRIYAQLAQNFAMRHGDAASPERMTEKTWMQFGHDAGVSPRAVRRTVGELAPKIIGEAEALMDSPEFSRHIPYAHVLSIIGERTQRLSDIFGLGLRVETPPVVLQAPGWARPS